jgi:hypothetical protein
MLLSDNYAAMLAVFLLYLGLVDGVLKLVSGSQLAALGRDVLLAAIVLGAVARLLASKQPLRIPPLGTLVVLFVVCALVQLANPRASGALHTLGALRPHLEFVVLFFFGYAVMRTKRRLRAYLLLLCVVAAANGVASLVQFVITPDQLASWGPGYEQRLFGSEHGVSPRAFVDAAGQQRNRPFGLGSDIVFGGTVGVIAVPALIALMGLVDRRWSGRLGLLLGAGILTAVITSQSRSAVVAAIAALLAMGALLFMARLRVLPLVGVVVLAVTAALIVVAISDSSAGSAFSRYREIAPSRAATSAYNYRVGTITLMPEYLTKFPLGAGLGSVGPALAFDRAGSNAEGTLNGESQYTFLVVELGIPGLLVFLAYHLRLLSLAPRIRRFDDGELRLLLAGVCAPLFAFAGLWFAFAISAGSPGAPMMWFTGGILAYWLVDRVPDSPPGRAIYRA